ncbi:unnamed protein product, partial [marine sediment metagenome]
VDGPMKIKAYAMKSCLNCRNADVFTVLDHALFPLDTIMVECLQYTSKNVEIKIMNECPSWEKKG